MSKVKTKYLESSLAKILKLSFPPVNKRANRRLPRLLLAMTGTSFLGSMLYYAVHTEMPLLISRHPVPHQYVNPSSLRYILQTLIRYLFKTVIAQKQVPLTFPLEYQEKSACVCKFPKNSVLPRSLTGVSLKMQFSPQYKFWEEDKREIMPQTFIL